MIKARIASTLSLESGERPIAVIAANMVKAARPMCILFDRWRAKTF